MKLETPVSRLPLVGPAYVKRLEKLALQTAGDLLYHFPFRYDDYSRVSSVARARQGETLTLQGKMVELKNNYARGWRKIQKGILADKTGSVEVTWFNQPYLVKALRGKRVSLAGRIETFGRLKKMTSPEYEVLPADPAGGRGSGFGPLHTGRLVPVYHETKGVSSKWLRSRVAMLLQNIEAEEFLPETILREHRLISFLPALKSFHFPEKIGDVSQSQRRFAFEELFLIHLKTLKRKRAWQKKKLAQKLKIDAAKILEFQENLPFDLTRAQKRVLREIIADLGEEKPMNRLLEGDVGSGKTVIAAAAIYAAFLNKTQSALMAPTEILADQHLQTLKQILKPLGVKIGYLTGSTQGSPANFDLLVGTHALINRRSRFKKLGLVVIDEQHRFGVAQRSRLTRQGSAPHLLTMTATPIPRTVALTLYGDLDLSVIDELPPGRQKVKTWTVPQTKRSAAYDWIRKQVKGTKQQAFVICPLIEESASETLKSVRAASVEYEKLRKEVFPDLRLGLLHGRLKTAEKTQIVDRFKKGNLDILVSTPVVEVGIDVPAATIMLIEAADRFGLAQLHQLRGRVGRGGVQSYCLLFFETGGARVLRRLKAMETNHSGLALAEFDLAWRGPGEIYGVAQHGFMNLKVASFSDRSLIETTKKAAGAILKTDPPLKKYPLLKDRLKKDKMEEVAAN